MDDERLHRSLQQCQDRLKTCLIMQYGVSEAFSTKTPVFLCCLILLGWFDCMGILCSSICIGSNLYDCQNTLAKCQISKKHFSAHTKLFIIFFFSKLSAKVADVGKLLWAQTLLHSLCVSASVPLIAIKRSCSRFSSTLMICVHCRTPFYITPPFLVTSTFMSVNL